MIKALNTRIDCDDVAATRAALEAKGAQFSTEIDNRGFGLVTMLKLPGADDIVLDEPRHPEAHGL